MDAFVVLDTKNSVAVGGKAYPQKTTKALFANTSRQKLGDISNLSLQSRTSTRDDKSQFMLLPTNDYINQLQKENMSLKKLLDERNKLIEVTGSELRKLRINLQKMQLQNSQLAQSNSQLLAELNSGKDRLKALQHELGCQNGLLKAKSLDLQVDSIKYKAEKESKMGLEDEKHRDTKRRSQSKSLGSLQVESRNGNENKRPRTRRQSAKFERAELRTGDEFVPVDVRTSEHQPSNDSLHRNKNESASTSIPLTDEHREDDNAPRLEVRPDRPPERRRSARFKPAEPKPLADSLDIYEEKVTQRSSTIEDEEGNRGPVNEVQEVSRCSLSRPSRQAAKKVQSYKEIPLKVKMRRQD